jgi:hypothetical protein
VIVALLSVVLAGGLPWGLVVLVALVRGGPSQPDHDPKASDFHGSNENFGNSLRGDNSNFGRCFYDD